VILPVAAALLAATVAGCGQGGATATAGTGSGGDLTVLVSAGGLASWPNLDPIASGTANADYRNAIFGELFHQQPDNSIGPSLATGYKFSADNLSVTITLRSGVTFSDGTPFNAAAVKFNIDRDLLPANACACVTTFRTVTSVTTSGDDTVVLGLSQPNAAVISGFVNSALNWIASPTALQKDGAASFGQRPVGAGPFVVSSNTAGQKLVLKKNPTYWQKGLPKLDSLTFQTIGSDQSAYAGLQSGSAQVLEGVTTPSVLTGAKSTFALAAIPPSQVWQLQFNTLVPPLNNPLARQALMYATDSESLDKYLFNGLNKMTQSPTASGDLFYTPTVSGYRTFDLQKAKDLVSQLGGLTLTIQTGPSPANVKQAEALIPMWQKAGIKVTKINQTPLPTLLANYKSRNWQVNLGFSGATDPALNLGTAYFFGSKGDTSGVSDPNLDGILTQALGTTDTTARAGLYRQAFQVIADNAYAEFLYENQTYDIAAKSVHGLDQSARWVAWEKVSLG
jgi:peptide/nickel transport system substrate-binding protein